MTVTTTSGCAAGGWCSAARPSRSTGAALVRPATRRWTPPWPRCTTPSGGEPAAQRSAGLGASAPRVARWLGDIRQLLPEHVVQVMQRDAIERLDLTRLLLEPEMLDAVEPDVHLVGTLLSLNG